MPENFIHIHINPPGELSRLFDKTSLIGNDAKQRGYDITTKSQIIDFLCEEINKNKEICIQDLPNEIEPERAHFISKNVFIKTISDVEAYILQVNSCWELWKKHYQQVSNYVNKLIPTNELLHDKINEIHEGKKPDWLTRLKDIRNLIAHDRALYIAIDLNGGTSKRDEWDLIFMKENLTQFDDEKKFFTFKQLVQLHHGYICSNHKIYTAIDELLNEERN